MQFISNLAARNSAVAKRSCETLEERTKLAIGDLKNMAEKKKRMATSSKSSKSGIELDEAYLTTALAKHKELLDDTVKKIDETISETRGLVKLVSKQRVLGIHAHRNLPETVFCAGPITVKCRGRTVKGLEVVASCVRLAGTYSVAMNKTGKKIPQNFVLEDNNTSIVFPEEPRGGFFLDRAYPLVGFEETPEGNTVAVFLTGIALGKNSPKTLSLSEINSSFHQLSTLGHRFAKVPLICMFGLSEDTIELDEFESNFIPNTQPMDPDEMAAIEEAFRRDEEQRVHFNTAPAVERELTVYESFILKETTDVFSLSPIQVDMLCSSWCNENASRSVKSGGFSGEINGVNFSEMNDISCFSDCIDVYTPSNSEKERQVCVAIESNQRLFYSNSSPFTKVDAEKYNIKLISKRINDAEVSEDDFISNSSCSSNLTTEETNVIQQLKTWNHDKYDDSNSGSEESTVSWWSSFKPPLKVMGTISSGSVVEDREEVTPFKLACNETDAVVKSKIMADVEGEVCLQKIMCDAFPKMERSTHSLAFRAITSKLKQSLNDLDAKAKTYPTIWSENSVRLAKGMMIDEATSSCVAQLLTAEIVNNKSGVLSYIKNNHETTTQRKYEGQRKHVTGNIPIVMSMFKSENEQLIDRFIKIWIKKSLPNLPSSPNVFTPLSMVPTSSSTKKRLFEGTSANHSHGGKGGTTTWSKEDLPRKMLKSEEGNSIITADLSPPTSPSVSSLLSSPSPTGDQPNTVSASIIPPSFIKPPRINNGEVADYLADAFGRCLYGMGDNINTFNLIRGAINGLKSVLLNAPLERFNTNDQVLDILLSVPRASDVERRDMDALEYEAKRLATIMTKSNNSSSDSFMGYDDDEDFYLRFSHLFKHSSESWVLDASDGEKESVKTLLGANSLRRSYEEYNAYKMFVHLLIFNTVKRELEGSNYTHNAALTSAFAWYCTVVARNRVSDVLKYVPRLDSDSPEGDFAEATIKQFLVNMCSNKTLLSVLASSIAAGLNWVSTVKIPSGYLKQHASGGSKRSFITCDSLDETSRYVFPDMKVGEKMCVARQATRMSSHVLGPYYIPIDFQGVGIDSSHAKLFVDSSSGKGFLSVSPNYCKSRAVLANSDQGGRFVEDLVKFVSNGLFFHSNKSMAMPTLIAAPTNPDDSFFGHKSTSVFKKADPIKNSNIAGTCQLSVRVPWDHEKHAESSNMWRCGFSVSPKLCALLFSNRSALKLEASCPEKVKMCQSIADRLIDTGFKMKMIQRICKNLNKFTQESPAIMAGNLRACPPAEMDISVINPDDGGDEVTLATFKVGQEEYAGGLDNYGSSFFHFAVKSIKFAPVAKFKENTLTKEERAEAQEIMEIEAEGEEVSMKVAQAPLEDIEVNASILTQMINTISKQLKGMQRVQYKNSHALNKLENKKRL